MTTEADEIANLRAGLENILAWCHQAATDSPSDVERAAYNRAAQMARRALKTPRASKIRVYPLLTPTPQSGIIHS